MCDEKKKINLSFQFMYNYNLQKKTKKLNLKSIFYFYLILNFFFKKKFKIFFLKKKLGYFSIFKAPYKNKMAQRIFYFSRFFFKLNLIVDINLKKIEKNIIKFLNLGTCFFFLIFFKIKYKKTFNKCAN